MSNVKYEVESLNFEKLKGKVSIPLFQRRLVWNDMQKKEFIKTLNKGFPFGAILIYQDEETTKKFKIIDGLQRYTTILDFEKAPYKYMEDDFFLKYINKIFENIEKKVSDLGNLEVILKKEIQTIFIETFKDNNIKNSDLFEDIFFKKINNLLEKTLNINMENNLEFYKFITRVLKEFNQAISTFINVDKINIPIIRFTGSEDELADVFEQLNKGGRKLSKYQVFSAQWSNKEIFISSTKIGDKIIEVICNRYEELSEKTDVIIDGYDREELYSNKMINQSELFFTIGLLIIEKLNVFYQSRFDKTLLENEDLANEIGYATMSVIFKVHLKDQSHLINKYIFLTNDKFLNELISEILNSYGEINEIFKRYLKKPGQQDKFINTNIATSQVISFFAERWVTKYTFDEQNVRININKGYKKNYEKINKNLILYFIRDLLNKYWSSNGDRKVSEIFLEKKLRYIFSIDRENLQLHFDEWLASNLNYPRILFDNNSKIIYNIFTSYNFMDYNSVKYDYEHIVSKKSLLYKYKSNNIPAGFIGNMMYLDEKSNRSKQNNNLYENINEDQIYSTEFLNRSLYPSENELTKIEVDMKENEFQSVKVFIKNRSLAIVEELINYLYKE